MIKDRAEPKAIVLAFSMTRTDITLTQVLYNLNHMDNIKYTHTHARTHTHMHTHSHTCTNTHTRNINHNGEAHNTSDK